MTISKLAPYKPFIDKIQPRTAVITPRLADVLDCLIDGYTNQQIANNYGISEGTVKTLIKRLFRALDAHDRAGAVGLVLTGRVKVLVDDPHGKRPA